jgi:exodeoxyribonuclease VII large subunit
VRTYQQRLDEFQQRAEFAVTRALTRDHNRVNQAVSKLEALDPTAVLERGYAILSDSERHVVTGWESTSAGARLRARLARGALDVEVVECLEGRSENAL